MKEKLIPTKTDHLPEIFKIIHSYPNFFDDTLRINSEADLIERLKYVVASLTIISNGSVVGCMWIDRIFRNSGKFNIIIKRKSVKPSTTLELMIQGGKYFFENLKLEMLFGLIRDTNKASLRLIKKIKGIIITETLKDHEIVNGQYIDCVFASILREAAI